MIDLIRRDVKLTGDGPATAVFVFLGLIALLVVLMFWNAFGFGMGPGARTPVLFLRPFMTMSGGAAINRLSFELGGRFPLVALDQVAAAKAKMSRKKLVVLVLGVSVVVLVLGAAALWNAWPMIVSHFMSCAPDNPFCEIIKNRNHGPRFPWRLVLVPFAALAGFNHIQRAGKTLISVARESTIKTDKELEQALKTAGQFAKPSKVSPHPGVPVMRAAMEFWPGAVQRIGEVCPLALIDLSKEPDDLAWAIDYLGRAKRGRVVIMLEEGASLPARAAALAAPVVRYRGGPATDAALPGRLRDAFEQIAGLTLEARPQLQPAT